MKTSITLPEALYKEIKRLSQKSGKGIGEIIVYWATLGKEVSKEVNKRNPKKFSSLNLGGAKIPLSSRSEVYDLLDNE